MSLLPKCGHSNITALNEDSPYALRASYELETHLRKINDGTFNSSDALKKNQFLSQLSKAVCQSDNACHTRHSRTISAIIFQLAKEHNSVFNTRVSRV